MAHIPPDSQPEQELRTKVAGGVKWGIIISIATQVAKVLFLIVLMRLLGPHSYGIVGQAALLVAIAQIFVHFGLAVSLVQRSDLEPSDIGTAFWLNISLGMLLATLMVLISPLAASFFRSQELEKILWVLAIAQVVKAATIVPAALLTRQMSFRSLATIEITSMLTSGLLGICSALFGADYWALVIQTLVYETVYLILVVRIGGIPNLVWSSKSARRLWSTSSHVMGSDIVNYISDQSDKFFVARFLGATPLALYSLAFRVPQLVLSVLTHAGRAILPAFSRLQNDPPRLARAFLKVIETVALVLIPSMTLTALLAPMAVPLIFGEAWIDAVVPTQLIALMTIPFVLGGFMGPLKIAVGRADWEFRWSAFTMIVSLVAFPLGIRWGINGVAAVYLLLFLVLNPIRFIVVQKLVPISTSSCLRALIPASVCSIALAATWWIVELLIVASLGNFIAAFIASAAGIAAYVILLYTVWPDDLRRHFEFARLVLRGERA